MRRLALMILAWEAAGILPGRTPTISAVVRRQRPTVRVALWSATVVWLFDHWVTRRRW